MQLSEQAILEFQKLYLLKFGSEISEEEAEIDLMKLIGIVAAIQPEKDCSTDEE
jgi:hypothetical protein